MQLPTPLTLEERRFYRFPRDLPALIADIQDQLPHTLNLELHPDYVGMWIATLLRRVDICRCSHLLEASQGYRRDRGLPHLACGDRFRHYNCGHAVRDVSAHCTVWCRRPQHDGFELDRRFCHVCRTGDTRREQNMLMILVVYHKLWHFRETLGLWDDDVENETNA